MNFVLHKARAAAIALGLSAAAFTLANPAPAEAACPDFHVADILADPNFTYTCGDKTLSKFNVVNFDPADTIGFDFNAGQPLIYTLSVQHNAGHLPPLGMGGQYIFDYLISVDFPSTNILQTWNAGATYSVLPSMAQFVYGVGVNETAAAAPQCVINQAGVLIPTACAGFPIDNPIGSPTASVQNAIEVMDGFMGPTQFTNTWYQAVPGPVPILGAGAAFGFSRKLRKRIKSVG